MNKRFKPITQFAGADQFLRVQPGDSLRTKRYNSGAYVLIIRINDCHSVHAGALQPIPFKPGYYAYVGSALQNLNRRIARHFTKEKRLRWHIDYLLATKHAKAVFAVFAPSPKRVECSISQRISKIGVAVPKFGSTDCHLCTGHLYFITKTGEGILSRILEVFRSLHLEPSIHKNI